MKILCLILLFHASLQLKCDKQKITAHIGGELRLICKYETQHFLYSKKYWCRGDSRNTCEILVDSEGGTRTKYTHRSQITDARRYGLFVKVSDLQFEDSGVYWVGIDKIYADIMASVKVVVTEVPVSKPKLRPLSSQVDRPTCWGQPVTVRCGCERGTGVQYTWYKSTRPEDTVLHHSSDIHLQCGTLDEDSDYYCTAHNDISSDRSEILSVQLLMPAESSCIYVINMSGQPIYDCKHRMSTTLASTSPPLTTCQATLKIHSDAINQSSHINQTDQNLFLRRAWTGLPLWYTLLRWASFASLLIFLCILIKCTKARPKRVRRRRRVRLKQNPHLVQ